MTNQYVYVNIIITLLNSVLNILKISKEQREKNKKDENHVLFLMQLDFRTSLGRAKRPKWDVQNVLILCVDRVERSGTHLQYALYKNFTHPKVFGMNTPFLLLEGFSTPTNRADKALQQERLHV